jgi:hypothetical protein
MAISRTVNALMARGFDSDRALKFSMGHTLTSLRRKTDTELLQIGLSQFEVDAIRPGSRPPLDEDVVFKLLHDSKRTCCICRDPERPIIIHHIEEYSTSHDNTESNLVVLCLEHHGEAHTKRQLSLTLTPEHIREHKRRWLNAVAISDARTLVDGASANYANWDYINLKRLFELLQNLGLAGIAGRGFDYLKAREIVDDTGLITSSQTWKVDHRPSFYQYQLGDGIYLYAYTKSLLEAGLIRLGIADLTNNWSHNELKTLLKPGKWIAVQGAFYFKRMNKLNRGPGQEMLVHQKRQGVSTEFLIDLWEATSSSAKNVHLSGYKMATVVLQIRSMQEAEGLLAISASCLAIGSHFPDTREITNERPPPSRLRAYDDFEDL